MRMSACTLLFLLLVCAPPASAEEPDLALEVTEILAQLKHATKPASGSALRRLQGLGPDAAPHLMDAYWRHPARGWSQGGVEEHESSASLTTLTQAIAGLGVPVLRDHVQGYVMEHPDGASRLRGLKLLTTFGNESTLPLAVDLIGGMPPEWRGTRQLTRAWADALGVALDKGLSSRALRATLRGLPLDLRQVSARVVCERGRQSEMAAVVDLISRDQSQVGALLLELSRAPAVAVWRLELAGKTRAQLQHGDRRALLGAAALAGRRRMVEVFPDLVSLLSHKDVAVRKAAESALRQMSSTSLGALPGAWSQWFKSQSHWLDGALIVERLAGDDVGEISGALQELARHRLLGLTYASDVHALLDHEEAGVCIHACATLHALGDANAVPLLVGLLSVKNRRVRNAAWKALVGLTGEQLPPDYSRWHEAVLRWTS